MDVKTVQMNIATAQIDFKMSFADLIWPKTIQTDVNNLLTDFETVAPEPFFSTNSLTFRIKVNDNTNFDRN